MKSSLPFVVLAVLLEAAQSAPTNSALPANEHSGVRVKDICNGLSPLTAQQSDAPFELTVHCQSDSCSTIHVTLAGKTAADQFLGFLVQAHRTDTNKAVGTFEVDADSEHVVALVCGAPNRYDAVFQKQMRVNKSEVKFEWHAPEGFAGEIVFNATVVRSLQVYWVGVQSPIVQVQDHVGLGGF